MFDPLSVTRVLFRERPYQALWYDCTRGTITRLLTALVLVVAGGFPAPTALGQSKPRTLAPKGYAKTADALMNVYTQADRFSGTVLVAQHGVPIFRRAYGFANREWRIANTLETKFRIASVTKQFTAAAILQLGEQGRLSLDDPVSKYYTGAPSAWASISLHHLLTHTSGIPSYTNAPLSELYSSSRIDRTPEALIALTRDKPLEFLPGSKFAYDNTGYLLLGQIIETVSGQSYAVYLENRIFGPLGMRHTGYDENTQILPARASGYTLDNRGLRNAYFISMTQPYAAGSLYSTAGDLLIWDQALHASKVISASSVAAMFTDYGFGYGFGEYIGKMQGHLVWGHAGGINGFTSKLTRYPAEELTVIVLSNLENAEVDKITEELAESAFGEWVKPTEVTVAPAILDEYAGAYLLAPGVVLRVRREGDHLTLQLTRRGRAQLYASAEHAFFAKVVDSKLVFDPPVDGKSGRVLYTEAAAERPATRISEERAAQIENTVLSIRDALEGRSATSR